jgi:hypothetical protein
MQFLSFEIYAQFQKLVIREEPMVTRRRIRPELASPNMSPIRVSYSCGLWAYFVYLLPVKRYSHSLLSSSALRVGRRHRPEMLYRQTTAYRRFGASVRYLSSFSYLNPHAMKTGCYKGASQAESDVIVRFLDPYTMGSRSA